MTDTKKTKPLTATQRREMKAILQRRFKLALSEFNDAAADAEKLALSQMMFEYKTQITEGKRLWKKEEAEKARHERRLREIRAEASEAGFDSRNGGYFYVAGDRYIGYEPQGFDERRRVLSNEIRDAAYKGRIELERAEVDALEKLALTAVDTQEAQELLAELLPSVPQITGPSNVKELA